MQFDSTSTLIQSSFFGGSGSDRVLGLTAIGGPAVLLAGTTTSTDLPLHNATQSSLGGPSDGFVAKISTDSFSAYPFWGAKGLRSTVNFSMGDAAATASATVTVTSSDSSQVLVALGQTDAGQPSVNFPGSTAGGFSVDCLTDHGGANVTISSPGYASLTLFAACYPAQLGFSLSSAAGALPVQTYALGTAVSIYLSLEAGDPAKPGAYSFATIQPGGAPITLQLANSNNTVGRLSNSSIQFVAPVSEVIAQQPSVYFSPLAVGQSTVSFQSSGLLISPSNQIVFTAGSPLSPINPYIAVPVGFQVALNAAGEFQFSGLNQQVTITSGDPANLLVSTNATTPGSASAVAGSGLGGIYLQAVGGVADLPLTLSTPGFDPLTFTVHATPPVVGIYSPSPYAPLMVKAGASAPIYFDVLATVPPNTSTAVASFLPGSTTSFSFASSNPSAVTAVPSTVTPACQARIFFRPMCWETP